MRLLALALRRRLQSSWRSERVTHPRPVVQHPELQCPLTWKQHYVLFLELFSHGKIVVLVDNDEEPRVLVVVQQRRERNMFCSTQRREWEWAASCLRVSLRWLISTITVHNAGLSSLQSWFCYALDRRRTDTLQDGHSLLDRVARCRYDMRSLLWPADYQFGPDTYIAHMRRSHRRELLANRSWFTQTYLCRALEHSLFHVALEHTILQRLMCNACPITNQEIPDLVMFDVTTAFPVICISRVLYWCHSNHFTSFNLSMASPFRILSWYTDIL